MSAPRIEVLRPGLLDTVQDLGRPGWRGLGVGLAGAVDAWSLEVANRLVGNPPDAAGLEITLSGPRLRLRRAACIALTGAPIEALIDGAVLPSWRPVEAPAGCTLELGACRHGARSYLAVDGGLALEPVLGSRATDLRAALGGLDGRALRSGDVLPLKPSRLRVEAIRTSAWWIDPGHDLDLSRTAVARFIALHPRAIDLCRLPWRVSATSNRQGLRLQGMAFPSEDTGASVSEPVAPGVVQLPPDGQPIVLMAEAQTVGGYPRLGFVAQADLPRIAQLRPGQHLHFEPVTPERSIDLLRTMRAGLARMVLAIDARLRR